MSTESMPSARSSRPSLLSGTLEIVKYAEFLSKEYAKALAKSIKEVAQEETKELRKKAKESSTAWAMVSNAAWPAAADNSPGVIGPAGGVA